VPNGGARSRVEAKIRKGLGVRAGVPDLIAVKDGRTYALEIKSPGGLLTVAQNAAHAALRAAGAIVVTTYSLDDAITERILTKWGEKPLAHIDQIAIDTLAAELYPNAPAATRNRQVYTPVSAIMKRAGIERRFKRPKGWQSPKSVSWLRPEQAFALFAAADNLNPEFGLFLRLLCYTGMRLSEGLGIRIGQIDLASQAIYLPRTKNDEPRTVYLTPELVAALANHPRGLNRNKQERLIRYHAGGRLRDMLADAMTAAGLSFPRRQRGFHLFRRTWAMWMRRFGGLDTSGLVETGAWRNPQSARRYEHLDASEEARKADMLPWKARGGGN
jgi:integrase